MIIITESNHNSLKISSSKSDAIESKLKIKDLNSGKTGMDILEENGIRFAQNGETPIIGLSKHGDRVPGLKKNQCVLIKLEPPIYNLFWGLRLSNKGYNEKFGAVMSTTKIKGLNQIDFRPPNSRIYELIDKYFTREKTELLCMILRNKKIALRINSIIPTLWKYTKFHNMNIRERADKIFCEKLGKRSYHSYGRGWKKPCFLGSVENRYDVLSKYKFIFCPENSQFNGYVTEKPLEAMCCGSVPIYIGAPDVYEYLPKGTFIDYRKYSPKELVNYIKNMSDKEYETYKNNIENFLNSDKINEFSHITFANKLVKAIKKAYKKK